MPRVRPGTAVSTFPEGQRELPGLRRGTPSSSSRDFPAYLVIVIVGHLIVPAALHIEMEFAPSYWIHLALWLPLILGLSLGLLQPIKGAVVATQWRLGMHGFAYSRKHAAP
jgi:uncharacterized protein (DUF983 family)